MSSFNVPSIYFTGTNSTIVGSLGSRKSILWPTKGMLVIIKQGVLLLDPKPGFVLLGLLHDLKTLFPVVSDHGLIFVIISFTKNKDVITEGKGTRVHLDRLQIHIRIGSISLITWTTIVVPGGQIFNFGWFCLKTLDLGPHTFTSSINPNISCTNSTILRQIQVLVEDRLVGLTCILRHFHKRWNTASLSNRGESYQEPTQCSSKIWAAFSTIYLLLSASKRKQTDNFYWIDCLLCCSLPWLDLNSNGGWPFLGIGILINKLILKWFQTCSSGISSNIIVLVFIMPWDSRFCSMSDTLFSNVYNDSKSKQASVSVIRCFSKRIKYQNIKETRTGQKHLAALCNDNNSLAYFYRKSLTYINTYKLGFRKSNISHI